jgi:hypothetical protein
MKTLAPKTAPMTDSRITPLNRLRRVPIENKKLDFARDMSLQFNCLGLLRPAVESEQYVLENH